MTGIQILPAVRNYDRCICGSNVELDRYRFIRFDIRDFAFPFWK
jgi:hypothetical protein